MPILTSAAGQWASLAELEWRFGHDNVVSWSQMDNNATIENFDGVQMAFNSADAYINRYFLSAGGYAIPIATTDPTSLQMLKDIELALTIWFIYTAKGFQDLTPEGKTMVNQMTVQKKFADDYLLILSTGGNLNATRDGLVTDITQLQVTDLKNVAGQNYQAPLPTQPNFWPYAKP